MPPSTTPFNLDRSTNALNDLRDLNNVLRMTLCQPISSSISEGDHSSLRFHDDEPFDTTMNLQPRASVSEF